MMQAPIGHINAIGTAVPGNDVHRAFIDWAQAQLEDRRERAIFLRMAARSGISHRWSVLETPSGSGSPVEAGGFYDRKSERQLPSTADRMAIYAEAAPRLALDAIRALREKIAIDAISHLVVASCTGFTAPGIDQIIARELGLDGSVERTLVGFMGCYAAVAALRVAHHIARSDPDARILVVTVELSTLHLRDERSIEPLLAMLQFADGAAAALVSRETIGLAMHRFFAATLPDSHELIQWKIGNDGFAMHLSGEVPGRIGKALASREFRTAMLGNRSVQDYDAWAVHAGGRSILDAVEAGLNLEPAMIEESRNILNKCGNMSSSTLLFTLSELMERERLDSGIALAFGPGLAAEGFTFGSC